MENNIYEINTIKELVNIATDDNIDNLMLDLTLVIKGYLKYKKTEPSLVFNKFTWIDDGENNIELVIKNP